MAQGERDHDFVRQTAAATRVTLPDKNVWVRDSAAINHMTGYPEHVLNRRGSPIGQQFVTIGDGTVKKVLS